MKNTFSRIAFPRPGAAELRSVPTAAWAEGLPGETLIETEFSIVSPGTELACLGGKESWAPLPFCPGYGSVGRVVRQGSEAGAPAEGTRIFTYGPHAGYGAAQALAVPLPEGIDPARATFARIGAVSITALRVADVGLGDVVAVFGLGPVGNFAAQLFALAGCTVIGIDLSEARRELARQCGIPHVLAPGDYLREAVAGLTGGRMCRTVVEATGVPAVAGMAITLAGKNGELILLGSPRGEYSADMTSFLNRVHLWGEGCVTVKGAHEWRFPVRDGDHARHSMERNAGILLDLIASEKLRVAPLLTHLLSPAACQEAYDGLQREKDRYLGVVFDWSKV